MRILIVSDFIFPDDFGGSAKTCYLMARVLLELGHEVIILSGSHHSSRRSSYKGIKFYFVHRNPNFLWQFVADTIHSSNFVVSAFKPNLIILNHPASALGVVFSPPAHPVPKLYFFYSPWTSEFIFHRGSLFISPFLRRIECLIFKRAIRVLTESKYMRDEFLKCYSALGIMPHVVELGVDTELFTPFDKVYAKREVGFPSGSLVFGTVRPLKRRTGVDLLIKAFELIHRELDSYLFIIGEGKLRKELEFLSSCRSSRIKFLGFVPEDKLPLYLSAFDLFITPSVFLEGFGLATVEALSCGTPVVVTPVGANPEVVGRFDASLIASSLTPDALADKIIEVSRRVTTFSQKCREYVLQNFSLEKFGLRLIKHIKEAVSTDCDEKS